MFLYQSVGAASFYSVSSLQSPFWFFIFLASCLSQHPLHSLSFLPRCITLFCWSRLCQSLPQSFQNSLVSTYRLPRWGCTYSRLQCMEYLWTDLSRSPHWRKILLLSHGNVYRLQSYFKIPSILQKVKECLCPGTKSQSCNWQWKIALMRVIKWTLKIPNTKGDSTAQVSKQVHQPENICWNIVQYQYASLKLSIKHSTSIFFD